MNQPQELSCPRCGAKIFITDEQCMACGAELERGQLVEAEPPPAPGGREATPVGPAPVGVEYRTLPGAPVLNWGDIPVGGGLFDMLSRSWSFFIAAMRMLFGYPLMLVPSLLSTLVAAAVLGAGYLVMHASGVWQLYMDAPQGATPWQFWAMAVPFVLLSYAAMMAFMGMVVHMVGGYLKGQRATLRQAFADVVRNFPALFYLAVVNTVVDLLTSLAREKRRSAATEALTEAVEAAKRVSNHLLVPVIMLEDKPLKEAAKRAYALFRRRVIDVVIAEAGLLLANKVIGVVLGAPLLAAVAWAAVAAKVLLPLMIAVAVGVLVVQEAVTGFVRVAYYTCLYLWAAAMESKATELVPAPEPLAIALSY